MVRLPRKTTSSTWPLPSRALIVLAAVLAVLALFPAVASAAANCGIQPLVLIGNTTANAGLVNVRLENRDVWMPVSIVEDATIVDSEEGNTDTLRLPALDVEIEHYPFIRVEREDGEPSSNVIGLGANSTLIRELFEARKIPSRSYGLSYDVSTLSINSLVLGGQDRSRYNGTLYESELRGRKGGGLNVEVESIALTKENGKAIELGVSTNFTATLSNTIEQLVLPSPIAAAFQRVTDAQVLDSSHLIDRQFKVPSATQFGRLLEYPERFRGSLTITLRNGYKATIPPDVLSRSLAMVTGKKAHLSAVLEAKSGQTSGVFGVAFLSRAYLSVDYEGMKFSLANRVDDGGPDVSAIGCSETTPTASTVVVTATQATASSSSSSGSSSGTGTRILGPVLGSLVGAIVVLIAILFLVKRYNLRQKMAKRAGNPEAAAAAATSPPTSRGLGGADDKHLREYDQVASSSRLWDVESICAESEKGISSSGVGELRGNSGGQQCLQGMGMPTTPSRASLAPSRASLAPSTMAGTPARNSYFTEEFHDIVRSPPR